MAPHKAACRRRRGSPGELSQLLRQGSIGISCVVSCCALPAPKNALPAILALTAAGGRPKLLGLMADK